MEEPPKETIEDEKRKKLLASRKKYRETHKEQISEKMKALYQKQQVERGTSIECECGATFRKDGLHRHVLTAKHQRFLKGLEPKQPLTELEKHERFYEYVPCQCGVAFRRHNKTKHFWTSHHKRWLKEWLDNCSDVDEEEGIPQWKPILD